MFIPIKLGLLIENQAFSMITSIEEGGKEDTFRRELNRMKKAGDIAESDSGILTDALSTGAQFEGDEIV